MIPLKVDYKWHCELQGLSSGAGISHHRPPLFTLHRILVTCFALNPKSQCAALERDAPVDVAEMGRGDAGPDPEHVLAVIFRFF